MGKMKNKGRFCNGPFVGGYIGVGGEFRSCAVMRSTLSKGTTHTHNPIDLWNTPEQVTLRKQFLNGEEPEQCKGCLDDAEADACWAVNYYNENFEVDYSNFDSEGFATKPPLGALWLSFSNRCKFACRECTDGITHTGLIMKKMAKFPGELIDIHPAGPKSWDRPIVESITPELVETIREHVMDIKRINFNGGDPTLDPLFFEVLDILKANAEEVKICIHFNGYSAKTQGKSISEYLKPFKNIVIEGSLDSYGQWNDEIRLNSRYQEVIGVFKSLSDDLPQAEVAIHCTPMNMNALTMGFLIKDIVTNHSDWIDRVVGCRLINPRKFKASNLPPVVKARAVQHIHETIAWLEFQEWNSLLGSCANMMNVLLYTITEEKFVRSEWKECQRELELMDKHLGIENTLFDYHEFDSIEV